MRAESTELYFVLRRLRSCVYVMADISVCLLALPLYPCYVVNCELMIVRDNSFLWVGLRNKLAGESMIQVI